MNVSSLSHTRVYLMTNALIKTLREGCGVQLQCMMMESTRSSDGALKVSKISNQNMYQAITRPSLRSELLIITDKTLPIFDKV